MSALVAGSIISAMLVISAMPVAFWVANKANKYHAKLEVFFPVIVATAALVAGGYPILSLAPYVVVYGFRKRSSVVD